MNRRSFLNSILTACVAPHFLPGGGRIWKAALEPTWVINPEWESAKYRIFWPSPASQRILTLYDDRMDDNGRIVNKYIHV